MVSGSREDSYILECERTNKSGQTTSCFKTGHPDYFNSDKVIDIQHLLSQILMDENIRRRVISAVCAWEGCGFATEQQLAAIQNTGDLAKVLISGVLYFADGKGKGICFAPLPNFIFTRDIGIVINDHLLLGNAATPARERETLLMKFITYYFIFNNNREKVLEISESSDFFLKKKKKRLQDLS